MKLFNKLHVKILLTLHNFWLNNNVTALEGTRPRNLTSKHLYTEAYEVEMLDLRLSLLVSIPPLLQTV